jgi:outer membrane protein assembly factor BamD
MRRFPTLPLLCACAAAIAACSSSAPTRTPSAEEEFRAGMAEYQDGNYQDAIQHFEVIRLQFPASSVADSARFYTGMARFDREEYILAGYEFSLLVQNHPGSPLTPDAYYWYAECYYHLSPQPPLDQSYTQKAIDALQTFIEANPKHPKVDEAEKQIHELYNKLAEKEYRTGLLYLKLENTSAALIYFSSVVDRYYNTEYADDALAAKIRILMRRPHTDELRQLVKTFLRKYPESDYRGEIEGYRDVLARDPGQTSSRN